jgi:hypothetical protein
MGDGLQDRPLGALDPFGRPIGDEILRNIRKSSCDG